MSSRPSWRFDDVEVDVRAWRVTRSGREVAIEPKGLELLALLVERSGEVVSKEEILDTVWRETAVTDNAMVRVIAHVRAVLGDDPKDPRYIETVHRRGYRFVAPVEQIAASSGSETETSEGPRTNAATASTTRSSRSARRTWRWALLVVALAAIAVAALWLRDPPAHDTSPTIEPSLAILPLENLGETDQHYFADGMTEAITAQLAKLGELKVIARSAAEHYRENRPSPSVIGRELGVAYLVEGSTLLAGDRVRITAHLVEAATDRAVWADSYEGDLEDVLQLQARVARGIAHEIQRLTTEQEDVLTASHTVDRAAYEEYLRGLYEEAAGSRPGEDSTEPTRRAIAHLARAVEIDPEWGEAHAKLARAHLHLAIRSDVREERPRAYRQARLSAETALELDPDLAEAHRVRAATLYVLDRAWEAADESFREAQRLEPNYAGWEYADFLIFRGRFDEAVALLRRAQERDPARPNYLYMAGLAFVCADRLEDAEGELEWLRRRFPDDVHVPLLQAIVLNRSGRHAEAADLLELHREALWPVRATTFLRELAYAAAKAEQPERAGAALRELVELGGGQPPWVLVALGDIQAAADEIESRYQRDDYSLSQSSCWPEREALSEIPRMAQIFRENGFD